MPDTESDPSAEQPGNPASAPAPQAVPGPLAASEREAVAVPPIVGIGASAGGLDALERFFMTCPVDSGVAFVVIQHLSPDHKTMMGSLLSRHTRMPVLVVEGDTTLRPDHVYLLPPAAVMRVTGPQLRLSPKMPRRFTLPIDIFFSSMAESHGRRAVAIVLSGTGSDGTRGAGEVNSAGGLVLAQNPDEAKFDGMPRSVIGTGVVDAVLPAEEMAPRAIGWLQHPPVEKLAVPPEQPQELTREEAWNGILQLLREHGDIDFTDYKPTTLMRRIERRMPIRRISTLADYLHLLEEDRSEIGALRRELLISVTRFFRDPESFEALSQLVVDPLVADRSPGEGLRVWLSGVSTGEEAYSIAILFIEAFERQQRWCQLKIFATDADGHNVEFASQGSYPESAAAELSSERLDRFFTRRGAQFVVKGELRQHIVFARHNLLADPPFTRMDLVVCRNTLIYFKAHAQDRALLRMQYAINPGGYLFLGSSESLAGAHEGFTVIDGKHKLFRRTSTRFVPPFGGPDAISQPEAPGLRGRAGQRTGGRHGSDPLIDLATSTLAHSYAPPTILVNRNLEALHLFGDLQPFLTVRPGAASLDLHRILTDSLALAARTLLFKAMKDQVVLQSEPLPFENPDAGVRRVQLCARPIQQGRESPFALLSMIELAPLAVPVLPVAGLDLRIEALDRVSILEQELQASRESLQSTIEELEASNEELQATNEELIASNEELQSSNEELQSVNEELNTVNAEFQEKLDLLNRSNADLDSMAKSAGVATVFVDEQFRLTRFSPDATQIFKLRNEDIGRRLDDFAHSLYYPELMSDLERTLRLQEAAIEREVASADGSQRFLARVLPYSVPSSRVRGAVATFVNITAFHEAPRLQCIVDALPEQVVVIEPDASIAMVNAAWRQFIETAGIPELAVHGRSGNYLTAFRAMIGNDTELAERAIWGIRGVLEGSLPFLSLQYSCHLPTERRWFVMNVAPVRGHGFGAVVSHVNISTWYKRDRQLRGQPDA